MEVAKNPDALADALTGVYATDPHYGAILKSIMKVHDLYQYDA
jgi:flagellum-specific peptidoglycan hydrolase FlgJ